jgi:hypothetical protein
MMIARQFEVRSARTYALIPINEHDRRDGRTGSGQGDRCWRQGKEVKVIGAVEMALSRHSEILAQVSTAHTSPPMP